MTAAEIMEGLVGVRAIDDCLESFTEKGCLDLGSLCGEGIRDLDDSVACM